MSARLDLSGPTAALRSPREAREYDAGTMGRAIDIGAVEIESTVAAAGALRP